MGRFRIAVYLMVFGVFFTARPVLAEYFVTDMADAAKRGDYHAVHRLIDDNRDKVFDIDAAGYTALHWAAVGGHWRIFTELVAAGAPVNAVGGDGGTPLHWACHHDRPEMIRLLLDAGADVGIQNRWGRTALHVAARRSCVNAARLLLERGADPNSVTLEGWTSLHVAYLAGHQRLVRLLLESGADPEMRDSEGMRPRDSAFSRPEEIKIETLFLEEYVGIYDFGEGSNAKVWLDGGHLRVREFASDDLYAIGRDEFFCRREPWLIRFLRDATDRIESVEFNFLRQTAVGIKAASPRYVGSQICITCHGDADHAPQSLSWMGSRHGHAYWRLGSDWALFLAQRRPHYRDVADPITDDRCLFCHTVGRQDPNTLFASTFRPEEGVGCEACHGPGSLYIEPEIMADRKSFLAAGGRIPDENTCRSCHRNSERFDWTEMWSEIEHCRPTESLTAG